MTMSRIMAKTIKRGEVGTEVARYMCKPMLGGGRKCGSIIEFSRSDVKSDQRDGNYVICPVCESWINVTNLDWEWIK